MIYERFYSQVQKCFHFLDMLFFLLFFFAFFPAGSWEEDAASASLDSAGASWLLQSSLLLLLFSSFASSRFFATQTICHQVRHHITLGWPPSCPCRTDPSERKTVPYSERMLLWSMTTVTDENKLSFCFISWGTFVNPMVVIRIKNITKEKQIQLLTVQKSQKGQSSSGIVLNPPKAEIFYLYQLQLPDYLNKLTAQ